MWVLLGSGRRQWFQAAFKLVTINEDVSARRGCALCRPESNNSLSTKPVPFTGYKLQVWLQKGNQDRGLTATPSNAYNAARQQNVASVDMHRA